ncbi:MAG: hypothetical protein M5U12_32135 [Verrucomicrobia bacterium]|nr:hypothetical protein [Verrucomicrobiota bacterium]
MEHLVDERGVDGVDRGGAGKGLGGLAAFDVADDITDAAAEVVVTRRGSGLGSG